MDEIVRGQFFPRTNYFGHSGKRENTLSHSRRSSTWYQEITRSDSTHFPPVRVLDFIQTNRQDGRHHTAEGICDSQFTLSHLDPISWTGQTHEKSARGLSDASSIPSAAALSKTFPRRKHDAYRPKDTETIGHFRPGETKSVYVDTIRLAEKDQIKKLLLPGQALHVYGPPMVGKSVLVDQAIVEMGRMSSPMKVYTFNCKFVTSAQQVFAQVHASILGRSTVDSHVVGQVGEKETQGLAGKVKSALRSNCCAHHVFVFHKTETLRTAGEDYAFLTFLSDLVSSSSQDRVRISAIFTTYKPFPVNGANFKAVRVGMLTDPLDIMAILERYAPGSYGRDYVLFCQRILPLPEAVRRLAEEYLGPGSKPLQCAQLKGIICQDEELMSLIFRKRAKEIKSWIGNGSDFNVISHIVKCLQSTVLNKETVEEAYRRTNTQQDQDGGSHCFKRLVKKYLLLQSDTLDSLTVHPLALYYFNGQWALVPAPAFDDHSSKSYTQFLCRVLIKTDQAMKTIGSDSHVFGCRAQDWPHTKALLEVAVHSATGGYGAFFKVTLNLQFSFIAAIEMRPV